MTILMVRTCLSVASTRAPPTCADPRARVLSDFECQVLESQRGRNQYKIKQTVYGKGCVQGSQPEERSRAPEEAYGGPSG